MSWLRRVKAKHLPVEGQEQGAAEPALELTQGAAQPAQAGEPLQESTPAPGTNAGSLKWRWLEWALIIAGVTFFCWGFLDLRSLTNLPGNEADIFQALDWTLVNSLRIYHAFPMWNPYIMSGIPFAGDPMLHVYNPVVTLPVLLFGVRAGFKLALYFSFLIAAFGMWRLALVLGMRTPVRVWMALTFVFAGQPAARFFQGQYLFVLGFAWIPWIISSLIQVVRLGRLRDVALSAVFLALLFFSGNAYYPFYMLVMVLLLGLVLLPSFSRRRPYIRLPWGPTIGFLLVGVLALGLIAIQLLPMAEFWPRLSKDMKLEGSHSLTQIFLDFTSKDTYRPDAYTEMPAREEFYAYIGLVPFLALSLLPLAFLKRDRRLLLYFLLVLAFVLLWISIEYLPWWEWFIRSPWLLQFRHLLRSLVIGSFALIVLAGYGLDTLWVAFRTSLPTAENAEQSGSLKSILPSIGLGLLICFMLIGLWDEFGTNQQYLRTYEVYTPANRVMRWIRANDLGDYYTRHNPNNAWHQATISNNLRYLEVWYHFADIRSQEEAINRRPVTASPLYLTEALQEPAPTQPGAQLLAVVEDYKVYEMTESLPMAFLVKHAELDKSGDEAGPLLRSDVTPVLPVFSSPNRLEVIAEGHGDEVLVVLTSHYPGWVVLMDGEKQELLNVGGYLAVNLPPGPHQFEFAYRPRSFYLGLALSLLATGIVAALLLRELPLNRQSRQALVQSWRAGLNRLREHLLGWLRPELPDTFTAIYQEGALRPVQPLDLPESSQLQVALVRQPAGLSELLRAWLWAGIRFVQALFQSISLENWLFILGIAVYLLTRLIRLVDFPIYFFTDEAIQTMAAENLLHNSLRGPGNVLLPTYFQNGAYFNLSLSVYLQVLPTLLFGKSVFVTRAVSVLVSLLGSVAVGLTLRDIFKARYWWAGLLLLSLTPAWFLHSRTAFETVIFVSFYALMFYFYMLYRYRAPRYLYPAIVMAGLAFYTYSPGQLIVAATWLLFLLSDLPYHWQNRRLLPWVLGLVALLAIPYLRFRLASTFDPQEHLRILGSYWLQPLSLEEKLARFRLEYGRALSPAYWFLPNQHDLSRHLMKGYGHISRYFLPFAVLGLAHALWKWRFSAYRNTLVILLVAPLSSALVGIGITRVLVAIIPLVLLISLGLELALGWLEKGILNIRKAWQPRQVYIGLSLILAAGLCWANFAMLRDALVNGPTWYQDYTLGGMQYGARQLYTEVTDFLDENPDKELIITPSWTNGADVVANFFLPPTLPAQMGSIEGYMYQHLPLDEQTVFVMLPDELDKVYASGKFQDVRVLNTLYYPNHQPGFYFVTLRYADEIDSILAQESEARKELQVDQLTLNGQVVEVRYSPLDMGTIQHIFDGDLYTVARSWEANPLVIELIFPEPTEVSGFTITTGSANVRVTAILYDRTDSELIAHSQDFQGSISTPGFSVDFDHTQAVSRVRFEILEPGVGEPAHVHVWEIELR